MPGLNEVVRQPKGDEIDEGPADERVADTQGAGRLAGQASVIVLAGTSIVIVPGAERTYDPFTRLTPG